MPFFAKFDFASGMPKSQVSEAPAEAEGGFQRAHPHIAVVVEGQQVGEGHLHRCIDEETTGQLVARHQPEAGVAVGRMTSVSPSFTCW